MAESSAIRNWIDGVVEGIEERSPAVAYDLASMIPDIEEVPERLPESVPTDPIPLISDNEEAQENVPINIAPPRSDNGEAPEKTASQKLIDQIIHLRKEIEVRVRVRPPLAPTTAGANPQSLNRTFSRFASLPAELRLKIWSYSMPGPNVLTVMYDVEETYPLHRCYSISYTRGTWAFGNKIDDPFVNLHICQESRFEALKSRHLESYRLIELDAHNADDRAWFNFDMDVYFMTTNEHLPNTTPFWYRGPNDKNDTTRDFLINPPDYPPYSERVCEELRFLGIDERLWFDWPFAEDLGSMVTCDECGGTDNTQTRFQSCTSYWLKKVEKVCLSVPDLEYRKVECCSRMKRIVEAHFAEHDHRSIEPASLPDINDYDEVDDWNEAFEKALETKPVEIETVDFQREV